MNVLKISRPNDETIVVTANGEQVGYLTHDELGWSGMEVAEDLAKSIAEKFGAEIVED